MKSIPGIAAPRQNLQLLLIIRWVLVTCLLIGSAAARFVFDLPLPYLTISLILLGIVVLNIFTWLRLRRSWAVTAPEFFAQIVADIIGVTLLFYFSGGGNNPFVFYYLVPLSISAATLPWRFTWLLAALSFVCYTLLLFFNVPIPGISPEAGPHAHHGQSTGLGPHVLGMWFNFIIGAALITYFVVQMSEALKSQQQELNEYREENLRDEQVLAVATLAAGTAHELASPLTTVKLLLNEMQHDYRGNTALEGDLQTLSTQVDLCSSALKQLARRADIRQQAEAAPATLGAFCQHIVDRWLLLRPEVRAQVSIQSHDRDAAANFPFTMEQAIINLLNNAADAATDEVQVSFTWIKGSSLTRAEQEEGVGELSIIIEDDGAGMPGHIKEKLGQHFVTTKGRGMGLGIFLSNATIARGGGSLQVEDREGGGTRLVVTLPVRQS